MACDITSHFPNKDEDETKNKAPETKEQTTEYSFDDKESSKYIIPHELPDRKEVKEYPTETIQSKHIPQQMPCPPMYKHIGKQRPWI